MKIFMVRHTENGEVWWGTGNDILREKQIDARVFIKTGPARALRTRLRKYLQGKGQTDVVEFDVVEHRILD